MSDDRASRNGIPAPSPWLLVLVEKSFDDFYPTDLSTPGAVRADIQDQAQRHYDRVMPFLTDNPLWSAADEPDGRRRRYEAVQEYMQAWDWFVARDMPTGIGPNGLGAPNYDATDDE